jgi:hypothetical protein
MNDTRTQDPRGALGRLLRWLQGFLTERTGQAGPHQQESRWHTAAVVLCLLLSATSFGLAAWVFRTIAPGLVGPALREVAHAMERACHWLATVTVAVVLVPWLRLSVCGFFVWTGLLLVVAGWLPLAGAGPRETLLLTGLCITGLAHLVWLRRELARAVRIALNRWRRG